MLFFDVSKTTKIAADQRTLQGPAVDEVIKTVKTMYSLASPHAVRDNVGWNKSHWDSLILRDIASKPLGSPLTVDQIAYSMNAFRIYPEQIPNYGQLRSQLIKMMEDAGYVQKRQTQQSRTDGENVIKFVGRGQYGKLDFMIHGVTVGVKRHINQALRDAMSKMPDKWQKEYDSFRNYDYPLYKAFAPNRSGIDTFSIMPDFISVLKPVFDSLGYDTREFQAPVENQQVSKPKIEAVMGMRQGDPGKFRVDVKTPYSEKIVALFKSVHPKQRSVDMKTKIWTFFDPTEEFLTKVKELGQQEEWDVSDIDRLLPRVQAMKLLNPEQGSENVQEQEQKEQSSHRRGEPVRVRVVTQETNGEWHLAFSFLRKTSKYAESFKEIIKYSFPENEIFASYVTIEGGAYRFREGKQIQWRKPDGSFGAGYLSKVLSDKQLRITTGEDVDPPTTNDKLQFVPPKPKKKAQPPQSQQPPRTAQVEPAMQQPFQITPSGQSAQAATPTDNLIPIINVEYKEEGKRSVKQLPGEKYASYLVRGDYQDYIMLHHNFARYGFDPTEFDNAIKLLISNGTVTRGRLEGDLDGYQISRVNKNGIEIKENDVDKFYDALSQFEGTIIKNGESKEFKLYDKQKEGCAFLYSHEAALLGDETGVGKCVIGESFVVTNMGFRRIDSLWAEFAKDIRPGDENEEWATPSVNLYTQSVNDEQIAVNGKITSLFRQRFKGHLRKITTTSGKTATTTYQHKFLTSSGWSNELNVGVTIASSTRLPSLLPMPSPKDISWEIVTSIEDIKFDGYIYDLEVEQYHNYIADNLVCHNTVQLALAGEMKARATGKQNLVVTVNRYVQDQFAQEIITFTKCKPSDVSLTIEGLLRGKKWVVLAYQDFSMVSDARIEAVLQAIEQRGKAGQLGVLQLDEVHSVKNDSKTTRNIQRISAAFDNRWGASATVCANKAIDLYNQFKAIDHPLGRLTYKTFAKDFGGMKEGRFGLEDSSEEEQIRAANKIKEWMVNWNVYIQRRKKDVRESMPENKVSSDPVQVQWQAVSKRIAKRLETYKKPDLPVSVMVATRAELATEKVKPTIAKAAQALQAGEKVAVFTCFKDSAQALINGLQQVLDENGGGRVVHLLGDMNDKVKIDMIKAFKDKGGDAKAMVISILAGGTGGDFPNVTRKVFVNDFDWTPKSAEQSEGRFFRITSDEDINTQYTIAKGTPDEEYYNRVLLKRRIAQTIQTLTAEQMELLTKGHRRGSSSKLREIENQLTNAIKEQSRIEKGEDDFIHHVVQEIRDTMQYPENQPIA